MSARDALVALLHANGSTLGQAESHADAILANPEIVLAALRAQDRGADATVIHVHVRNDPPPTFGAGLAAGYEEGRRRRG